MSVGRGVWFKKTTVEESLRLDMTFLAGQLNFESGGCTFVSWKSSWGKESSIMVHSKPPERIQLKYTITRGSEKAINRSYYIHLSTTPCHFGNWRWWFLCPNCYRRCRVLYLPPGESIFACRICHNLCYESQQEGKSQWYWLFKAMCDGTELERKLYRTRSPRKRAIIDRKLRRQYNGLKSIIDWGKKK